MTRQMGLKKGSKLSIEIENGRIVITPATPAKMTRAERYARIIADLEKHGPIEEINWGPDVGHEIVEW